MAGDRIQSTFAILDTGSQVTMIHEKLARLLNLDGPEEKIRLMMIRQRIIHSAFSQPFREPGKYVPPSEGRALGILMKTYKKSYEKYI